MKIRELFESGQSVRSFEVFPPKRDGDVEPLFAAIEQIKPLKPGYISVTYGAGGSTRALTFDTAVRLKKMGVEPLVHLTCVGHDAAQIGALLDQLSAAGIENILALRGDPPKGESAFTATPGGFKNAGELVAFIKSRWNFCVGVAGYPEKHPDAPSMASDLAALKAKVDAGADFVNTQLFFDNALYAAYVAQARAAGVRVPIVPGIMPVLDAKGLARFASFGTTVPDALKKSVESVQSEEPMALAKPGLDWASCQCLELLSKGAPGIHLYMMNKAWVALEVYKSLL
jgi:methylenetetrahydrofolate reductase (NADPH)